jgi:hypothetical protein
MPYVIYGVKKKQIYDPRGKEEKCVQGFGGGNQKKRDHLEE